MEKDLIYFGVDHNDVAFCYFYLTKYNAKLGREITYRVDFDVIDRPMVELMDWYIHDRGYVFSPLTVNGEVKTTIYMHRQCAQGQLTEELNVVDHIDYIKTNNRRSNLRATTLAENTRNQPLRCPFGWEYIQPIHIGKYEAYAPNNEGGAAILLGTFKTREEAVECQKEHIKKLLESEVE